MIKIKELPIDEKPQEKALRYGIESLSNRELLALILRSGYKGVSVLEVCDELLMKASSLSDLKEMTTRQLCEIKGMSLVKSLQLQACFEISKRASYQDLYDAFEISKPVHVAAYMNKKIGHKKQEHFVVLFLDVKNRLVKEQTIFIGILNASLFHAREVFKAAIECSCAKIMVVHNHPTGICIPSEQDYYVTNVLKEAGKIIGIEVLDHIIVGKNKYFSFAEHQLMK